MGININIQTKDGKDHPEWDFCRQGDDTINNRLLSEDCVEINVGDARDGWYLMRPTETTKLIGSRGEEMMSILQDPKWWVYVSH